MDCFNKYGCYFLRRARQTLWSLLHSRALERSCNEAVRRDMGSDTLRSRRNKAKLKWWYKLVSRYLKQLYSQEWNIKPLRGI